MLDNLLAQFKEKLWRKYLPLFVSHGAETENPYDYFAVYFVDVERCRYQLASESGERVILKKWNPEQHAYLDSMDVSFSDLDTMETEILHYRRHATLSFNSIIAFTFNRYTRFAYTRNFIARGKGKFMSALFAKKEVKSRDRITLLNLLVNEYVVQRPSKTNIGVTTTEVIDLLYGKLWYKHIRSEEFSRKVTLLLQSLVITEDLKVIEQRYFVQGKAIATIVTWEKDERRDTQQTKMQKNMIRLMLVITVSTLMITLAILAQAGIVNLHRLWETISQLKPIRILFKLI